MQYPTSRTGAAVCHWDLQQAATKSMQHHGPSEQFHDYTLEQHGNQNCKAHSAAPQKT